MLSGGGAYSPRCVFCILKIVAFNHFFCLNTWGIEYPSSSGSLLPQGFSRLEGEDRVGMIIISKSHLAKYQVYFGYFGSI